MQITVNYNTATFDAEAFMKRMELVALYAQNQNELSVYITDNTFTCGPDCEVLSPDKVQAVKEAIAGLNEDLREQEEVPSNPEVTVTQPVHQEPGKIKIDIAVHGKGTGVCKNCDTEFTKRKKSDAFCSPACRKEYFTHKKKSRKERAAEVEQGEELKCPICGEMFHKHYPKQKCCTPECQKLYTAWNVANRKHPISIQAFLEEHDAKKAEKKRIAELPQRECAYEHCHKKFTPSTDDQKYCCHECKEAAHEQRKTAKVDVQTSTTSEKYQHVCEVCETPFSDNNASSRFCSKCLDHFGLNECLGLAADNAAKKAIKVVKQGQRQYKVCPRCGRNFSTVTNQFFCDICTQKALKAKKIEPLKSDDELGLT